MKIIEKIKAYYGRRSRWSLAADIAFYLLLILLVIPPTRKEIMSGFIRLTMRQPSELKTNLRPGPADYSWPLWDEEGRQWLLEDFRGRPVFLNFWATWCPPCVAELPAIEALYREYGDRVAFLLVTREDPQEVRAFLDGKGYTAPFYIQRQIEPEIFRSSTIPATFILSPDGDILVDKKGAARWDGARVRALLDRNLPPG